VSEPLAKIPETSMPARVAQPRYRARREAIGRKSMFEAEFLMTDDDIEALAAPRSDDPHRGKRAAPTPSSPVTVSSLLLELMPPEVQPIVLPDAWTVVGKGGRPIKNAVKDAMYDQPKPEKKKRVRVRKVVCEEDEDEESLFLARLEDAPSSSKCTQQFERSTMQHFKQVTRSRDAKMWARYRLAKQEAILAQATALMLSEAEAAETPDHSALLRPDHSALRPTKQRRLANSRAEKTRRKAREAHARERCYWPEAEDEVIPAAPQTVAKPQGTTARQVLVRAEEEHMAPMATKPVAVPERSDKGKGKQSICSVM